MKEEITFTMGLRGGVFREAHPRYSELSVSNERESGYMAFDQSISGKLKFIDTDYDWIMAQERGVEIIVNFSRKNTSLSYIGKFVITDCDIDEDNRIIEVELEADDPTTWLKEHYEDSFNLVALAPENRIIEYQRRGAWEYYRQGDTKLSVVMGGDYFELDATQTASHADLIDTYHFALVGAEVCFIALTEYYASTDEMYGIRGKKFKGAFGDDEFYLYSEDKTWRLLVNLSSTSSEVFSYITFYHKQTTGAWKMVDAGVKSEGSLFISFTPSASAKTVRLAWSPTTTYPDVFFTGMYARIVHNNANASSKYDLPTEDIVTKTLNYNYVSVPSSSIVGLLATDTYSAEATEWGLCPDNTNYYTKPDLPSVMGLDAPLYPVGKTTWGAYSWWCYFDYTSGVIDYSFWNKVLLKDAYPLASVLSVLLDAVFEDSGYKVTFAEDEAHSGFFYGDYAGYVPTPPQVFITPKSNVLTSNYSQKAQKGDITIGAVLDMLRDVFRCYWFMERDADGNYILRIEHIGWFYNGGSYDTAGGTPFDIRNAKDPRTGKLWEYGKAKFSFDTAELYSRYEFGWQDDATDYFSGDPVSCLAKYVNGSATNKAEIKEFATDIDYMLLSPDDFSKDGFALLGAASKFLMYDATETQKWTFASGTTSSGHTFAQGAISGDTEAVVMRSETGTTIGIRFLNSSGGQLGTAATSAPGDKVTIPAGTATAMYVGTAAVETTLYFVSANPIVDIPTTAVYGCAPQNYRLAFKYIERNWYKTDYPCRELAFGDGADREKETLDSYLPIKKAMEQTLGLPYSETFDPYKGVLSTKGAALVNKYEINLLSLFQELTLMYGTDEK